MPFFGWQFLLAWLFVCGSLFLELVQPKLFEAILDFVSDTDTVYPPSYGWSLVAYVLLVAVLSPPVKEQYFHRMLVTGAKIRTGLIGAIYAKSLRLSSAARQKFSQGYIQTLQGVDTDAIQLLPRQIFNGLFKANVQLAVVFYLLYQQIGLAFIPGFLIVVLSSPVQVHLMNKSGKQEKLRLEAMDKRIRLMGEALKGMLVVKFNNLNVPMQNSVKAYRIKELTHIRASQVYQALSAAFWQLQPFLIALSCFGTYIVLLGQSLTPTRTFTTLALLRLMNSPMNWLRNLFVQAKRILVSARRIDAFFKAEEIQDVSLDERVENGYIRVMEKDIRRDADRNADAVVVHAAFGSWEKGAAVAVHVDDLQIKQGDFVSVVGQTGEGKSSLVSMLLGELFLESGSVKVCGKIAYVSQQAWILSGTIRDNILFGSAYNDEHYNSVLSQCALLRDLEIWPDGDMTEIGERGITCSGGQKQRISLARAVYARADVYILDDPLSALDAHVAKHIFHAVLGKEGVLAECTRILVTHGIHFLPAVDRILLIKGGQIVEDGDYPKLVELGGEFAKLSKVMEADERKMREAERGASSSSTFPEGEDEATIVSMGEGVHVIDDAPQSAKPAQLVSEEEQSEGSVGWKAYSQYADAFSYQGVLVCLTLCILSKGIEAGASWWLGVWSSETPEDQVSGLIYYFGIYAVFVLVVSFFGSVYTYVLRAVYALKAATVLHDNVLDSIMKAPMSFFDVTPTGRILNRFSKDVDTLCDALPVAVSDTLLELVIVISGIGVCTIATPYYILMVLPLALPYIWLQKRYLGTSRDLRRLHAITRSPIYQLVDECLDGLPTLRAYRMQENFTDRLMRIIDVNNNAWISNLLISRWFDVRIDTVGLLALVISAALCVASKGTVDPALAGLALIYASSTAGYLSFFVQDFCLLEVNIVSVERINEYVDCPQESSIFAAPVNNERSRRSPSEGWPSAGTLEFKNYGTSYRPGLDLVLRELNFTVESRERIGIVGRTGSGKSSLVLALTRILEAAEGAIELDGYNISHINLSDLRKHITVVPQEPILFASSIRENLDPFGIYADDLIWSVLEKVRMKAWAKGLPERLEAPISEGGSNLSVGERQLLCMAKALLQKSRILVLDEATSSIDIKTDELIQKILREEFVDSTILCIAHRINTILDYDKILVLEGGVVKEFNTPDALLSNSESVFYKLCRSHQDHRT
ncbi:P-loop containing nucleoside triphosphate hydrolase protein [Chytriomyces sp. MP71]|nr:P-loop containing nucleoside triphosphate hydrolase protein [Chytriomyces sp. MP71]